MAEGVSLARRATCEATGTAILLTAIIGSAIMAQRLAAGDGALSLLANALATGGALLAVIAAFGPYSGGHFNPLVTLSQAWQGNIPWRGVPVYILAQLAGAVTGVAIADLMFGDPVFLASQHARAGAAQVFSETVSRRGHGCGDRRPHVRRSGVPRIAACSSRSGSGLQRNGGDIRSRGDDLVLLAQSLRTRTLRGTGLHHGGLLVYLVDLVRQPRGHDRAFSLG